MGGSRGRKKGALPFLAPLGTKAMQTVAWRATKRVCGVLRQGSGFFAPGAVKSRRAFAARIRFGAFMS